MKILMQKVCKKIIIYLNLHGLLTQRLTVKLFKLFNLKEI